MDRKLLLPGTPCKGGYCMGQIIIAGLLYDLISPPKEIGEFSGVVWNKKMKEVTGALSWNDGLINTHAMAKAGSEIAKLALGFSYDGCSDYYIGAVDEHEPAYRNLKPTDDDNWCYARSGINLSANPPTLPYTPDFPKQTEITLFKAGGAEAFEPELYWTSTQPVSDSDCAWAQDFDNGDQVIYHEDNQFRVRLFRRSLAE